MKFKIATIPGDGIGKEVVPEGVKVLNAVGERFGIEFEWDYKAWSCEHYATTGAMMLEHLGQQEAADAIIAAIEDVIENPATRTGDMGGTASTAQCGDALVSSILRAG